MSILHGARARRIPAVAALAALLALASLTFAPTAPAFEISPKQLAGGHAYVAPISFFRGVYAAEDSSVCLCHTVGAGDTVEGVSYNTGSSYRAYSGCTSRAPLIANGTGSVTLWIHGHVNEVICAFAPGPPPGAPAEAERVATVADAPDRQAWTTTEGDQVCLALEAADGGYGQGCYSQAEVAAGEAWTALGPAEGEPDQVTVATVAPQGAPAPVLEHADGTTETLPVSDGVATAVVPASAHATLRAGDRSIALDPLVRR